MDKNPKRAFLQQFPHAARIARTFFVFFSLAAFASITAQKAHTLGVTSAFYTAQAGAFAYALASPFTRTVAPGTCWRGIAHGALVASFSWLGIASAACAEVDAATRTWPWILLAANAWTAAFLLGGHAAWEYYTA